MLIDKNVVRTFLFLNCLALAIFQLPGASGHVWAAGEQDKAGPQGQASPGGTVTIPDGVIGVSLHVGAEHVGDPAQQAGLKQGDEVTTVDGVAVTGKTYEQVALMVRGEAGSVVKLVLKGEGGLREVSVTRVASQTLYKGQMGSHGGVAR